MKHFWDFNENKNFKMVRGYKVLKVYKDHVLASKILKKIDSIIKKSFKLMKKIKMKNDLHNEMIKLLINTKFKLQEMQLIKDQGKFKFNGLNKPKNIYNSNGINIGKDKKLRAHNRLIFLTLRNNNGKLKSIKKILPLVSHELTHTALNHVRWRDDDHGKPFDKFNKLILKNLRLSI